ncbi:MAG: HAMP domain-containing sensor histidine kinase [Halanaerobiales bacterium]
MNFKLKDKSLSIQIWIILGLILGGTAIIVSIIIPIILRSSFTRETYARLEDAQEYLINYGNLEEELFNNYFSVPDEKNRLNTPPFRIVRHTLISPEGMMIGGNTPVNYGELFAQDALSQSSEVKNYEQKLEERELFYLIRKVSIDGSPFYLVSYISSTYRDNLVEIIFSQLIKLLLIISVVSWLASLLLARYLTRPLKRLESKVRNIANQKWDVPVDLKRNDEIGKLGKTIDWMRKQLIERDEKQQEFLQEASHEMKTPIMVIRSYIQSLMDGIIPKKDMDETLKNMEDETFKMEKRVHSLLNITKIDHLANQSIQLEKVNLNELILKKVNRFEWRNVEIDWELDLTEITTQCDREKLGVVLDNIFDNQLKYAENKVSVKLYREDEDIIIKVHNDGPKIKDENKEDIFKKFQKGKDGEFGLGLAIAKFIIKLHEGEIWAENEDEGVSFYIKIPLK